MQAIFVNVLKIDTLQNHLWEWIWIFWFKSIQLKSFMTFKTWPFIKRNKTSLTLEMFCIFHTIKQMFLEWISPLKRAKNLQCKSCIKRLKRKRDRINLMRIKPKIESPSAPIKFGFVAPLEIFLSRYFSYHQRGILEVK